MAGAKKKTQFVRLPEIEEALRAASSVSNLEPALNIKRGNKKKKKSSQFDTSDPSPFLSTNATEPFSLPPTNEPSNVKQGRRRRDSDPSLFDQGRDGVDLDADFIAKYDSLLKSNGHEEKTASEIPLQENQTTASYATAAKVSSNKGNLAVYDLCPAALPSAESPASNRNEKTTTTIGRDMSTPKKVKKSRGQKNAGKPTGVSQQFKHQKKHTVLRLEDDIDKGFSVTGHRHWNVKKFNEHWEEYLPKYYKYRKDGE